MATPDSEPLPRLPPRKADSHKGDFGRALLIGGSRGMTGAIALAGMAALRSGAGLVQLAVPAECLPAVAAHEASYMTAGLPSDASGRISIRALAPIEELAQPATVVACGPGLGRSAGASYVVARLYARMKQPMILDADALNALSAAAVFAQKKPPEALPAPRILTPHPGEFARLAGLTTAEVQARREELAHDFAQRHGVVLILKGHQSVITDGARLAINTTGNPGMATGGTGDVLTGIVTALVAQGLTPFDAARVGAHLHGLAGDLAAAEVGEVSLIASDLIRFLPAAIQALTADVTAKRTRAGTRTRSS